MMKSKARCKLILDSCCDLPAVILNDGEVDYFQFPYIMNDGEHPDDLWQSMEPKEFYDRLRKGEVSGTAQIPLPTLTEMFENAAKEGTPTVYLAFTSGLSGTFDTATRIAEEVCERYPDFELYVVDTKLASIAEGLLVYEAIRQRDRGLSAKQLAEWAEEARWYVNACFTLEDLESLRRGGRIPDAAATLGDKLKIKPMLGFNQDGSLALTGVARGRKKALKALTKFFEDNRGENSFDDTVLVASADAEGDMRWVEEHLDRPKEAIPAIHCSVGPVIGSHVGPGMVALVFWGPDRRKSISIADRIANKLSSDN